MHCGLRSGRRDAFQQREVIAQVPRDQKVPADVLPAGSPHATYHSRVIEQ